MAKKENNKEDLAKRALPAVLLTVFLDVMGLGILIPLLPTLVNPHSPDSVISAGWSDNAAFIMLGWLLASFAIAQFIASPILGQLSDKFGRKKVLAISVAGTAIGYAIFAYGILTKSLIIMFAGRILDGLTGGNLPVAQAVVADVSTPKNRTRNFGLVGMMFGLGFALAPYISGKLATPGIPFIHIGSFELGTTPSWFSITTPFWIATALSAINVILIVTRLPNTQTKLAKGLSIDWSKSFHNLFKAVTHPTLRRILIPMLLFFGGFGFFRAFFQVLLERKLGFTQSNIGDFFAYFGICMALGQGLITPFVSKRFKNWQALQWGLLFGGLTLLLFLIPTTTASLLIIPPFMAIAIGQVFANSISLVSASATEDIQGEVLGINSSVQAFGDALPSVLSGYIAASLSVEAPVLVGGLCVLASAVVFKLMFKPSKLAKNPEGVQELVH